MSDLAKTWTGGCLCGAVRYRVEGPMKQVVACHCKMCRVQTGHLLATTAAWDEQFQLTEQSGLKWYQSSPECRRGFCGDCGSVLFFDTMGDGKISITAGTLDDDTGLSIAAHIFVANKGGYYGIGDGVEEFSDGGDSVPMPEKA